jgi:two-component system LytT family response regulator
MIIKQNKAIIKKQDSILLIDISEIYFIERVKNNSLIHTKTKSISVNMSLNKINPKLPHYFKRTHKSFIVNLNQITELERLSKNIYTVKFSSRTPNIQALISTQYINNVLDLWGEQIE